VLLAAALVGAAGVTSAGAEELTTQELIRRIDDLQAQLDRLKAGEARARQDAREVDATVDRVVKDADRRSQLLDVEGFTAGYSGGKFLLQSGDGQFVFHPYLQLQFRNITNYREDGKASGDDLQNGFETRRMKFGFDGNLWGSSLVYQFQWATDRHDGIPKMEDAWVKYKVSDTPFSVRLGQMKDPFAHEQLASSKYLLAVERSLITDLFANGDGYLQGATLIYDSGESLRLEGGITDGARSQNTNFQDFPNTTSGNSPSTNWGSAFRAEYKVRGNWKDYDRLSPEGYKEDLLVFGGGIDYTEAGNTDALMHTVDVFYGQANGLGLFAAYYGRYTENNQGGPGSNGGSATAGAPSAHTYDFGGLAQASYLLKKRWEPFLRYDYIHFDGDGLTATQTRDVHEITGGINYYLHSHAAKFTLDLTYLPNGSPVSDSGSGVLSTGKDKDELMLRAQFQLLL
jgi:hypothetical protein